MFNKGTVHVTITGRVGHAPTEGSGARNFAKFSVAANIRQESGEKYPSKPVWFKVTAFGSIAEKVMEHIRKGDLILVNGDLVVREWMTGDGEKRLEQSIIINSYSQLNLLHQKSKDEDFGEERRATAPKGEVELDDDIPF